MTVTSVASEIGGSQGFLAFDVETPDSSNARICQIGCVEQNISNNGISLKEYGYLVNPECDFSPMNIHVHGITEDDVAGEPDFSAIWNRSLAQPFTSHVLVAHNANFDMTVLSKTLDSYGVEHGDFTYVDTLQVARRCYPELPNHKLDIVSSYLGVNLDHHHDAACDAQACYGILMESIRRFGADIAVPRVFHLGAGRSRGGSGTREASQFREFSGFVDSIVADGHIDLSEAMKLYEWLHFAHLPSGIQRDLGPIVSNMLVDGVVSGEESALLLSRLKVLQNPVPQSADDAVEIANHVFVLTGDFEHDEKSRVKELIAQAGGTVKSGVSAQTDYVVKGANGSARWNHGSYGTKVEKALDLQNNGSSIKIVNESALYKALECSA